MGGYFDMLYVCVSHSFVDPCIYTEFRFVYICFNQISLFPKELWLSTDQTGAGMDMFLTLVCRIL